MTFLYTADQLPQSSAELFTEFDERYLAGVSNAPEPTWVEQLGDVIDVGSPIVQFPIDLLNTKYRELKGDDRFEDKYFDLKVAEFQAGYEAQLLLLTTLKYAYNRWQAQPARFLAAQRRFIAQNVASLIEGGTSTTSPWDGVAFFSTAHLSNGSNTDGGTFSNNQTVAIDPTDIDELTTELTAMMGVADPNGDKLGITPDTILAPTTQALALANLFKQDIIANPAGTAAVKNPYFGLFNVVHIPEFTNQNAIYFVDSKRLREAGLPLFAVAKFRAPDSLSLRKWDEQSDFFKNTGKLKISSHLWTGQRLVFPHAIRRVVVA